MIIDARNRPDGKRGRSQRAMRTVIIDTKTGKKVDPAPVAIDTMSQKLTFKIPKDERTDMFKKYREERFESGKYLMRDIKTGLEWPATAVVIPCLQRDGTKLVDCPCLDCLKD